MTSRGRFGDRARAGRLGGGICDAQVPQGFWTGYGQASATSVCGGCGPQK